MTAYYNEFDPKAASWLRELIKQGHIAPGEVDERSIVEVRPDDLVGYDQCHFFAGIGVWSHALRKAGWPDDRQVWTGSCPCQPFSAAGKRGGTDDARHLWPEFFRLIAECRPVAVFGEQVARAAGTGLRKVRHVEGSFRFSEEWERRLSLAVQDVLGDDQDKEQDAGKRIPVELPQEESGEGFGAPREDEINEAGVAVRSGLAFGQDTGTDRQRDVRSDGGSIQSGGRAHLGQPVIRQSGTGQGVCVLESSYSVPCGEQCDGGLGGTENCRYGERDSCEAQGRIERLISEARRTIEDANRSTWLGLVRSDMERVGYTFGSCSTPACGFGAPHIRQRLYFVAHPECGASERHGQPVGGEARGDQGVREIRAGAQRIRDDVGDGEHTGIVADSDDEGPQGRGRGELRERASERAVGPDGGVGELADADRKHDDGERSGSSDVRGERRSTEVRRSAAGSVAVSACEQELAATAGRLHAESGECSPVNGFWSNADWIPCRDRKFRAVESGTFPLAHGAAARVGRLRGYGNAIVAPVAEAFIEAYMEVSG